NVINYLESSNEVTRPMMFYHYLDYLDELTGKKGVHIAFGRASGGSTNEFFETADHFKSSSYQHNGDRNKQSSRENDVEVFDYEYFHHHHVSTNDNLGVLS
uniref:Kinesin motor domain-containing protein n=1 Tax=Haemonchus contortus TaxID=6289 RepID=A0A7I5E5R8_HAECO